jgi:hypothetical protein
LAKSAVHSVEQHPCHPWVIKLGETLFALSGIQPKTRNHPPKERRQLAAAIFELEEEADRFRDCHRRAHERFSMPYLLPRFWLVNGM